MASLWRQNDDNLSTWEHLPEKVYDVILTSFLRIAQNVWKFAHRVFLDRSINVQNLILFA